MGTSKADLPVAGVTLLEWIVARLGPGFVETIVAGGTAPSGARAVMDIRLDAGPLGGIEVVPTPGHAPGHQSLIVELADTGRVVLTGDAAFTRENLLRGEIPAMDQSAAKDSLALIRSLVNDDLQRVFTSHDADAWMQWRRAPQSYT